MKLFRTLTALLFVAVLFSLSPSRAVAALDPNSGDPVCYTYGSCDAATAITARESCAIMAAQAAAEGESNIDGNCTCVWIVFGPNWCGDGYDSWYLY